MHSLGDVNAKLRLGRYFFTDIVRDGITLYERPGHPFASPEPLAPATALAETQGHFDEWFQSATNMLTLAGDARARAMLREPAFLLHQAVERFYHCFLLVRSLYSPKTHALNRLRTLCEDLDGRLVAVWPKESRFERRTYELLRSAYVKARYSPQYRIAPEELDWLMSRVTILQIMVEELCRERLQYLREATHMY